MDIANCRRFQPSLCCHQLNSFVGLEGKKNGFIYGGKHSECCMLRLICLTNSSKGLLMSPVSL